MIEVSLQPNRVGTSTPTEVHLQLSNASSVAHRGITVELRTSEGLLLVDGDRRVDVERLQPGEVHQHRLRLRGTREGAASVVLRHLSSRDERGRDHERPGVVLAVSVVAALPPPGPAPAGWRQVVTGPRTVFVSHRSTDNRWFRTALVERLAHDLAPHRLVDDAHDLHGGEQWRPRLAEELQACAVLVALIGPTWTSGSEVLRWEVRTALQRRIPIVPVVFDGAPVPDATLLPPDIAALVEWQVEVVDWRTFTYDAMRLAVALRQAIDTSGER